MAILLIVLAVWIASSFGQTLLQFLNVLRHRDLECFVFSCAIGLGILSYGIYALGLVGLLSPVPIACLWGIAALAGLPGMRLQYLACKRTLSRLKTWRRSRDNWSRDLQFKCAIILLLIVFGIVEMIACYRAPGALEWDALAYHLADPKLYVAMHRVVVLPTEHHSNFPFTMEMLFATGLMYSGYPLANLFHFVMEVLTVLMLIGYGNSLLSNRAGYLAALLFASTPLIVWESAVAYIDIATALYSALSILACLSALEVKRVHFQTEGREVPDTKVPDNVNGLMLLSGATMGFALGTKYLALISFGLLLILMILRGTSRKNLACYLLVAVAIASPWYLKNALLMRNPVYPFFFRLFPQSRYWSEDRERSYRSEQSGFGLPHSLSNPGISARNLMETPWRLVTEADRYFNHGEFNFCALIGGLYGALLLTLLLLRHRNKTVSDLSCLFALQMIAWFFMAQIGRYLIQILPIASLLAGYTTDRLLSSHRISQVVKGILALLWIGQPAYTLWSLCFLPTGGMEAMNVKAQTGLDSTAISLSESLIMLMSQQDRDNFLHRRLDNYDACQWINQNTPHNQGVVMFEDTRGFYLDRAYLWGNGEHSSYIPYDSIPNAAALSRWFHLHGYDYALINLNWSPNNVQRTAIGPDEANSLLMKWYADPQQSSKQQVGNWRNLVGEALRQGLWTVLDAEHGNVVLKINSP